MAAREGVVQERPILENSTACTMSNAKNLVYFVPFLAVMDAGDSFGIHLNNKASQ
ncbi:hypothetical protein GCM10027057_08360 [Marisediminicola antarctica]